MASADLRGNPHFRDVCLRKAAHPFRKSINGDNDHGLTGCLGGLQLTIWKRCFPGPRTTHCRCSDPPTPPPPAFSSRCLLYNFLVSSPSGHRCQISYPSPQDRKSKNLGTPLLAGVPHIRPPSRPQSSGGPQPSCLLSPGCRLPSGRAITVLLSALSLG